MELMKKEMVTKNKRNGKVRRNLDLNQNTDQQLRQLKDRSNAASLTEVIVRSLAIYDLFLGHVQNGGDVVFVDSVGTDKHIKII